MDAATLVSHLASCRAVVFPAFEEDFGLVTVEAFASSKAVITCRDSGGPSELVQDGSSGLLCEPTPTSLAGAMAQISADQGLAERLGAGAAAIALEITWPRTVERLLLQDAR